jgi:dipeptidyl aminopeptidase/acylaminoacyl peptidase
VSYFWAPRGDVILYSQDFEGNENNQLYSISLKDGKVKNLTSFPNVQANVLAADKMFPDELLVTMNKDNPKLHDVYRLDLITGQLTKIAENTGTITEWLTDRDFQVRGALSSRSDGGFDFLIRENQSTPWRIFLSWPLEDSLSAGPVGFSKDGKSLYFEDSRQTNTTQLLEIDIATGKSKVIYHNPSYDINGIVLHPDRYDVQVVSVLADRNELTVFDPAIADDIRVIRNLKPDSDFSVTSRDQKDEKWLLRFASDSRPVSYYLYDRTVKKAEFLFQHQPALNRFKLMPMKPVSFPSRDGLTLHGYVTYPPGYRRQRLPMVLKVHGGPWARDAWGFDSQVQWLANRGYVCLQVNYRGSTGYGKSFVNAGDKEWGGKMQDDLIDAVKRAVAQKIADPKRIAIFGSSYGGYASLAGAVFTPDLFRCAVASIGPSNLISFLSSVPPFWSNYVAMIQNRVGDPVKDEKMLKERSPLFSVDRIKIPILLAYGANDPRVPVAEAEQIVKAMKAKGIDFEYLLFKDEGHGFGNAENRLKFYRATEQFLAKYLGGKTENSSGK